MAASVAQLAEQLICNQQVAGSTPAASSLGNGHAAKEWLRCTTRLVGWRFRGRPVLVDGVRLTGRRLALKAGFRAHPTGGPAREPRLTGRQKRDAPGGFDVPYKSLAKSLRRERVSQKDVKTGEFPERSKGSDCKSDGIAFAGSNPALPTHPRPIRPSQLLIADVFSRA